ncbi:MAG: prolyl oligopeptidase family serine peptidase [Clostridia bacterium]|nr:prolyl oligopeptidase family serine peptidase [Clostridia bacterium]
MIYLWISVAVILLILIAVPVISYVCFRMAFYSPDRDPEGSSIDVVPEGEIYEAFRDVMEKWSEETSKLPSEEFSIISFDGLKLYGRYYEYAKGAPIEIMFHGYRGSARRDLSGGVQRCFKLKRSALIVDQRAAEKSEGNVISFGVNEHKDCLKWIDFVIHRFGDEVKIILTGISMGASTVMMASGRVLPKNVIGVLADCGYNDQRDIIKTEIKRRGLPANIGYLFVKLGARLFGHFRLEEIIPEDALRKATVPVIFFHGDSDDFVPCEMSKKCFCACASRKRLVIIEGAGHGLSYPKDPEKYLKELGDFFGEEASYKE